MNSERNNAMINAETCWRAVQGRDGAFDGKFFFGVVTTGVYCRPSCAARHPLRENVRFYPTADDAERDGLRACRRCRPRERHSETVAKIHELCRYLESESEESHSLKTLAARAGISPFHLQRVFKRVTGVSPKQFLDSVRMRRVKKSLKDANTVTDTVYASGFGSPSRLYERADSQLGMTPTEYRDGGRDVEIRHASMESPLGRMMLGATARGICFLQFGETETALLRALRKEYPQASLKRMARPLHPDLAQAVQTIRQYLAGNERSLPLPVDLRATAFQIAVWNHLRTIPYGEVRTYSEVASGIGSPNATRAVAQACAGNRVALVIPCHRVVRKGGALGGYRWGVARKKRLLAQESRRAAATVS